MGQPSHESEISRRIWAERYRLTRPDGSAESCIQETWGRVARTLAAVEHRDRGRWEQRFYEAMRGLRFLPGGRILAGAGSGREVTLFNCFVMGTIADSLDGVFQALKEGAVTMQHGGGVGYDFSTLRPAGSRARRTGAIASGPVSFMRMWDGMCATMVASGNRRGAMMATLRCDHPDIEAFVNAKREPRALRNFNLSVLVTDAFMAAVRQDADWPLLFPVADLGAGPADRIIDRTWSGSAGHLACRVFRTIRARDLWGAIARGAYDCAEPGVLFIDRINRENNLGHQEQIACTNPCGEIPLPPYGACDLGAINLTGFVRAPFTEDASLDLQGIADLTGLAVRMLDDVIDASRYPLPQQAERARGARRIGLGITGLADALIMLGLDYGEERARRQAAAAMRTLCHAAYRASVDLAREKAPFPSCDRDSYLTRPFIRRLPVGLRAAIAERGIRNSHLISIAPTGTVSLLADNLSSGIEPVFSLQQTRTIGSAGAAPVRLQLEDYAFRRWRDRGGDPARLPPYFVTAASVPPEAHLAMQAALQPWVDNAISKTINVPADLPFERFRSLFEQAYELGLKGCTAFRPNQMTGAVLENREEDRGPCCGPDREND